MIQKDTDDAIEMDKWLFAIFLYIKNVIGV